LFLSYRRHEDLASPWPLGLGCSAVPSGQIPTSTTENAASNATEDATNASSIATKDAAYATKDAPTSHAAEDAPTAYATKDAPTAHAAEGSSDATEDATAAADQGHGGT
jgi:hypothetical protein